MSVTFFDFTITLLCSLGVSVSNEETQGSAIGWLDCSGSAVCGLEFPLLAGLEAGDAFREPWDRGLSGRTLSPGGVTAGGPCFGGPFAGIPDIPGGQLAFGPGFLALLKPLDPLYPTVPDITVISH